MACNLRTLTNNGCINTDGGIFLSHIIDFANIADIIFDTVALSPTYGCITDVITTGTGQVFTYEPDDDDTALYNQTGVRTNRKHTTTQTAFLKFAGVNKEKVSFANGIKGCCELLAFHHYNSGVILVQGVDFNEDTDTWRKSKQTTKATVNILSDTGANEDRIEINLNSVGRCFSPVTSMDRAAIEAIDNT